jgi:hypothetical protein
MNGNLLVIVVKIMAIAAIILFLDVLTDADDGETGNEEE